MSGTARTPTRTIPFWQITRDLGIDPNALTLHGRMAALEHLRRFPSERMVSYYRLELKARELLKKEDADKYLADRIPGVFGKPKRECNHRHCGATCRKKRFTQRSNG